MDTDTLVESRIEDGQRLLSRLAASGFDVTAASWVKTGDDGRWSLYIASRAVDERGLAAAYSEAYGVLQSMDDSELSMFEVKLLSPQSPVARDVLEFQRRHPGRMPTRTRQPQLGNLAIEEAYIYPPPVQQRRGKITLEKRKLKTAVEQTARVDELVAPLSPQESRAKEQIVASGVSPAQADYWVRKKREEERERPPIPAGTVVNAQVAAWWGEKPEDDPNPLLLVQAPDGAQGLTFKNNTEPVGGAIGSGEGTVV
jgi:hypothetical protein